MGPQGLKFRTQIQIQASKIRPYKQMAYAQAKNIG